MPGAGPATYRLDVEAASSRGVPGALRFQLASAGAACRWAVGGVELGGLGEPDGGHVGVPSGSLDKAAKIAHVVNEDVAALGAREADK